MECCPDCGTQLSGGWTQRTREVIELPQVPAEVTEHVDIARNCPACRRRCLPPAQLDGMVMGQQRLGVSLVNLIATLREEARLPIGAIQWYLRTVHGLRLSVGAIMAAVQRTAQRAQSAVDQILDQVRASPVVHADETGWRQDGHNGYVWTCSTPTHRYFLRRNRSKAVVDEALGDAASALVCDFYAPTTITTAPYNAAGLTCCGISTTCDPSTPMMHHWPGGLMPSTRFTTGPRPLPIPRPGSSPDQAAAHCPTGFGETPAGHLPAPPRRRLSNPDQAVPTHRAPHPGTLCLRSRTGGATGQQRRRTQPATSGRQSQGQRRHPVGRGQQQQDDPGLFIRHLARPRTQSPRRLPATALFPSTLNSYGCFVTVQS